MEKRLNENLNLIELIDKTNSFGQHKFLSHFFFNSSAIYLALIQWIGNSGVILCNFSNMRCLSIKAGLIKQAPTELNKSPGRTRRLRTQVAALFKWLLLNLADKGNHN